MKLQIILFQGHWYEKKIILYLIIVKLIYSIFCWGKSWKSLKELWGSTDPTLKTIRYRYLCFALWTVFTLSTYFTAAWENLESKLWWGKPGVSFDSCPSGPWEMDGKNVGELGRKNVANVFVVPTPLYIECYWEVCLLVSPYNYDLFSFFTSHQLWSPPRALSDSSVITHPAAAHFWDNPLFLF